MTAEAGWRQAGLAPAATAARREARIMARITEDARVKGRTAAHALACMADLVRYTIEHPASAYPEGVRADVGRLRHEGHAQLAARDYWACDTWKGISTTWRERQTGLAFEVQFHTPQSRAARDRTYPAYQRLRDPATTDGERAALMAWLRAAYAGAPAAHAPAPEKERAERALQAEADVARTRSLYFRDRAGEPGGERVTYYAISDRYSSAEHPAGVLRRVEHCARGETGARGENSAAWQRDEAFGRDLRWRPTFLLYSWERGNLDNRMHEISPDRALRITDQIRREVTSGRH
ncbi:MAG TPA: hypothetical protein VH478_25675 [Trebonia sp.]|nr:hypothetical protein [Trebonia sp.]